MKRLVILVSLAFALAGCPAPDPIPMPAARPEVRVKKREYFTPPFHEPIRPADAPLAGGPATPR